MKPIKRGAGLSIVLIALMVGAFLALIAHAILPIIFPRDIRALFAPMPVWVWAAFCVSMLIGMWGLQKLWKLRKVGLWLVCAASLTQVGLYVAYLDPVLSLLWLAGPLVLLPTIPPYWRDMT
jgi:hypothetical protein